MRYAAHGTYNAAAAQLHERRTLIRNAVAATRRAQHDQTLWLAAKVFASVAVFVLVWGLI